MNKFLALVLFGLLWAGCSSSEQPDVPSGVYEALSIHPDSAAFAPLMMALLEGGDETEEAWGSYLMAREIVRNGVSFDALTYLERAELLFRATNDEKGIARILLLKAHAYWALGA